MLSEETTKFFQLLSEILGFVTVLVLIAGVIMGASRLKEMKRPMRSFMYYLFFVLCIELAAKTIVYGQFPINNLFLLYPYLLGEFILLSLTYKHLLRTVSEKQYRWIDYYTLFFSLVIIGYSIYMIKIAGNDSYRLQLYPKLIIHGTVLFYSFQFILASFVKSHAEQEMIRQFIPINNGVFLYFSGSFVFFLMLNFLLNTAFNVSIIFFFANILLTLVFYLFCLFSIWKYNLRKMKS